MDNIIKKVEKDIDYLQEFIFSLRKFFHENPEIKVKYEKFVGKKEKLIY
jgi:hypothetical protein